MAAPAPLPIEARRAAWSALWKRLLAPPPADADPNADGATPQPDAADEAA